MGKKLINEDKVKFIIGPMGSNGMIALNPIVTETKTLMFGFGTAYARFGLDKPYTFGMGPGGKTMAIATISYLGENYPDAKTFVGIVPNGEGGWSDIEVNSPRIEALGLEQSWEMFEVGTTDFYPLLTKVLAKNPDVIDTCTSQVGSAGLLWKQLRELGYKGLIMASGGGGSEGYVLQVAGAAGAEGVIMPWPNYADDNLVLPGEKVFSEDMNAKYGVGSYDMLSGLSAYDAVYILVEAMKLAGTTEDVPTVAENMSKVEIELPDGMISWGGKETFGVNCQVMKEIVISQIRDGKQRNIDRQFVSIP